MTMALEAAASITSDSVTVPEAAWMTCPRTSSMLRRSKEVRMGSMLPWTSVLRMTLSSLTLPAAISPKRVSRVTERCSRAAVIEHGFHLAPGVAYQDHVSLTQGPRLDEHGGHGAAGVVQFGLQDGA